MNCHVKADGSKPAVIKRAIGIAATMQTALPGNNITCRHEPTRSTPIIGSVARSPARAPPMK